MLQFNAQTLTAIAAACAGKALALDSMKEVALQCVMESDNPADDYKAFEERMCDTFAAMYDVPRGSEGKAPSLAVMQKAKIPGVSTFYVYTLELRRLVSTKNAEAIANLTSRSITNKAKTPATPKPAAKPAQDKADPGANMHTSEPAPTTPDALIAQLQALHAVNGLTPAHYAAMQQLCVGMLADA